MKYSVKRRFMMNENQSEIAVDVNFDGETTLVNN